MSHVFSPLASVRRHVPLQAVTKEQLAREVNLQAQRIVQLEEQLRRTGRLLVAIVEEPEAFRPEGQQRASVARAAIDAVRIGTQVSLEDQADRVVITAARPETVAGPRNTPHIVIPRRQ